MNNWISVKNGLPEEPSDETHIYCLVCIKGFGIAVRPYNQVDNCWDDEQGDDYYTDAVGGKITH